MQSFINYLYFCKIIQKHLEQNYVPEILVPIENLNENVPDVPVVPDNKEINVADPIEVAEDENPELEPVTVLTFKNSLFQSSLALVVKLNASSTLNGAHIQEIIQEYFNNYFLSGFRYY